MSKVLILNLAVAMLFCIQSFAAKEGGGGVELEREFVKMAKFASTAIANNIKIGNHLFDEFNLRSFAQAIDRVEVVGLQKVCMKDELRCVDAQYLPEVNRIEFDVNIWDSKTCMEMVSLVVHEYGRASGNEDGNYKYSSIMDQASIHNSCAELDRQRRTNKNRL